MNRKLIAVTMLAFLSCPGYSQGSSDAAQGSHEALESIISLGKRISERIHNSFSAMETLATDEVLVAAIKDDDREKLDELSYAFINRLDHSLKVRIYIKGKEQVDNQTTPACGFACIAIVRAAYQGKPDAEALLFRSTDANITLARGIHDANGESIGAIVAHYPYSLLKNEIQKLTISSMFTELRQRVADVPITLLSHGDRTIKQGVAQKIIKIPQSRWYITVWTPGGVSIETYEPPSVSWIHLILAALVLVAGFIILVIYRSKRSSKVKPGIIRPEAYGTGELSFEHERDSPTLILGGGAEGIDVGKYLKNSDITDLTNKLK